jgi:tetratricopeptide (TPR) repeat protein
MYFSIDDAQVLKDLAFEALDEKKFKDALDSFNLALSLTPPDKINDIAVIYFNIGVCYQKLNNNGDAKSQFTKAVEVMPNYLKPRASRMNILKMEKEYLLALVDAKIIFELDPNYPYPGLKKLIVELEMLEKWKIKQINEIISSLSVSEEEKKGEKIDHFLEALSMNTK